VSQLWITLLIIWLLPEVALGVYIRAEVLAALEPHLDLQCHRELLTQSLLVLVVQVLQLLLVKQIIQEAILYLAVLHLLAEVAQVITKALVLLAVLVVAVDGLA
jgi:hypothetical protein